MGTSWQLFGTLGPILARCGGLLGPLGSILGGLDQVLGRTLDSWIALGGSGLDLGAILKVPGRHPGGPGWPR